MSETPPQNESPKINILPIRRPVTTAMIFLTLAVFGWKSYRELPLNLMPDISYPTLTVRTSFEGAAPEDVEKLLTRPMEETLSTVGGMVEISSISSAGLSEIVLEFTWDTDMNLAQQDTRDRLDLFEPPREVTEKPVILRYDPTLDPVMRVAIAGSDLSGAVDPDMRAALALQELTEIREAAERYIKGDLEAEIGIAQVTPKGGREEEIQVLVDAARLKTLGMSLETVKNALAMQNINLSGGMLKEGKTEYLVRTLNEFQEVEDIKQSVIGMANNREVRLEDVAQVFMGQKDRDTIVRVNEREAVELEIYKEGDANTVQVCRRLRDLFGFPREKSLAERLNETIRNTMPEAMADKNATIDEKSAELAKTVRSRLPEYAQITLISDQSRFIVASIKEVQSTAVVGGILALIILFFFLRELRSTVVIGIAIPVSIIATFIPMFLGGLSLNIMSLGGLALGVGMLVDNSIVVLESIFRCHEEGDGTVQAADRGTREVSAAVTASTLTTVAVFLPIAFVEGIAGQLFSDLALTVAFSLIASLLAALSLVPVIASRSKLNIMAHKQVVWPMRAYRIARERHGLAGALFALPLVSAKLAGTWFAGAAADAFSPVTSVVQAWRTREGAAWSRAAQTSGVLVALPLLATLFVLQLVLQFLQAAFVTMLFVFGVIFAMAYRALAALLRVILWAPLYVFDLGFNLFRKLYASLLHYALRFSIPVLALVLVLSVHSAFVAGRLGRELIPPMKQGEFGIRMEAPAGTKLEETEALARRIESIVGQSPEVETVSVEIGTEKAEVSSTRGENVAQFTVLLRDPELNARRQDLIIERLRKQIRTVTADEIAFTLPTLFSFKTAVELQIRGDDLEQLRTVGENVLTAIQDTPGLKDAELSVREGYPEIIVEVDRELLAARGIDPQQVAQRLRNEVQGEVPTRFDRGGEKIDIRVRSDRQHLRSVEDLRHISVTDGNPPTPLHAVARIYEQEGPSEIRRVDQRQVALITANVEGRDLAAVSREILEKARRVPKPADYVVFPGGQYRELQVSYKSLEFALLLAVFLVYVVMACQFESIWHPVLVMFSVPLAFIGVIYVLDAFNFELSVVVFLGGIVLAGIVVNDAIVLVDYINQLRRRGMSKREAVELAAAVRLRPILMTTLTTVLGLLPMALYASEGAEIRQPMAITVMAGLTSATFLTLVIIPMAYDLLGGRDKAAS